MARGSLRVGVAVILDPPVADEVDGLRRALGDPGLSRIAPHVTLVPPVNIRSDGLPGALAVLRAAAAAVGGPITLEVGPPATFLPDNPVLHLEVGGSVERLRELRDAVFVPPLRRRLSWPWVPHVTLLDGGPSERVTAAAKLLAGYRAGVTADRVVLLEERRAAAGGGGRAGGGQAGGRVWQPLADAALGGPVRVGTGGLELELIAGRVPDPQMWALAQEEGAGGAVSPAAGAPALPAGGFLATAGAPARPAAVTARRTGETVGAAAAWFDPDGPVEWVYVPPAHRRQGIGRHLAVWLRHLAEAS